MSVDLDKYLHFGTNKKLNELGSGGWRLVSHTAVSTGDNFGQYYDKVVGKYT